MKRARIVAAGLSVCALVMPAAAAATTITALTITPVPTPPLGTTLYHVSGHYPQVASSTVDVTKVDKALAKPVLAEEASLRTQKASSFPAGSYGIFQLGFKPSMMSASSVVVSVMYPILELQPGGNDGAGWLDATLSVPSATRYSLDSLLTSRATGLKAIAAYVEKHVLATNSCVRETGTDPIALSGFAATTANYSEFAFSRSGLLIGLEQGQVGVEACSSIRVTVPWSVVQPQLNATGLRFLSALR